MSGIFGQASPTNFVGGEVNDNISTDLATYAEVVFEFDKLYAVRSPFQQGNYDNYRLAGSNRWQSAALGQLANSFFLDFYFRIWVDPTEIDLGTIVSEQTRIINLWNAFPYDTANLASIVVSDPTSVQLTGGPSLPYVMKSLEELTYTVGIGILGPPSINVTVQFDFSDIEDPLPVFIVGSRAVLQSTTPETPVTESWEWKTQVIEANDGTEQRIQVRACPRVQSQYKVIFDSFALLRNFYTQLLTSLNRLWVPEYQYATRITAPSAAATSSLFFDIALTDIRDAEYALIITDTAEVLVEIDTVEAFGAFTASPLEIDVPLNSLIIPGSSAIIQERSSLERYPVDEVAQANITANFLRQRQTVSRPEAVVTLPTFLSAKVLARRPLAMELVRDEFTTGNQAIDNETGIPDTITRWDYTRVGGPRTFLVPRIRKPEELDYWKAVLDEACGQLRKFWVPTYRNDVTLAIPVSEEATEATLIGVNYGDKIFQIPTHRYFEFENASGDVHRVTVTAASVVGLTTVVTFEPALPPGAEWTQLTRISFLLPMRLSEDKITWKHYGLESQLSLSIRTAEV